MFFDVTWAEDQLARRDRDSIRRRPCAKSGTFKKVAVHLHVWWTHSVRDNDEVSSICEVVRRLLQAVSHLVCSPVAPLLAVASVARRASRNGRQWLESQGFKPQTIGSHECCLLSTMNEDASGMEEGGYVCYVAALESLEELLVAPLAESVNHVLIRRNCTGETKNATLLNHRLRSPLFEEEWNWKTGSV